MKISYLKLNKEKGYAILFTVVVVSIISLITIGLSNTLYRQMILSSVAKDSTTAFYQADIASECALYFDNDTPDIREVAQGTPYSCSGHNLSFGINTTSGYASGYAIDGYTLNPSGEENSSNRCFRILIKKSEVGSTIVTNIDASGYNICDKSNLRTVERSLKVTY